MNLERVYALFCSWKVTWAKFVPKSSWVDKIKFEIQRDRGLMPGWGSFRTSTGTLGLYRPCGCQKGLPARHHATNHLLFKYVFDYPNLDWDDFTMVIMTFVLEYITYLELKRQKEVEKSNSSWLIFKLLITILPILTCFHKFLINFELLHISSENGQKICNCSVALATTWVHFIHPWLDRLDF